MNKTLISTALSGLIAMGAAGISATANAADMEKCFGVAKAGKNDCQTSTSACAGTSKKDGQADAWMFLPKGTCDKIVGGSTTPKKG